ncbi:MAG: pyruvate kinase [Dehalococcoidales bacterium]
MPRKTKIVCTIGPASNSKRVIERLIKAGMNTARLNLSHGSYEEHAETIGTIRQVAGELGTEVAILLDMPGPKLRTGQMEENGARLEEGDTFTFTSRKITGTRQRVSVDSPAFFRKISLGNSIFLNDGALQLEVAAVKKTSVECKIIVGGLLTGNRGINIPGVTLTESPVNLKGREHMAFGIKHGVDFIAVSLVRSAEDIREVKRLLEEGGGSIPVIAKIEKQEAVSGLDGIISESEGLMIARGDLGVEIRLEKVPLVQKEIIRKCNLVGKPVIVATQMLESMVGATRPTRAEVSDVANAIFDGTDAVMLSGETAIGKYPVQTVRVMSRIVTESEKVIPYDRMLLEKSEQVMALTDDAISYSACHISLRLKACCIVAYTTSGSTALRVSKYRPRAPIIAITPYINIARRLTLSWGIEPHLVTEPINADMVFEEAARIAFNTSLAKEGELVVITAGIPTGVPGNTNVIKVHRVETAAD